MHAYKVHSLVQVSKGYAAELSARDTVADPDPRLLLFFSLQSGSEFQIVSL
jgi:hypothetical protein